LIASRGGSAKGTRADAAIRHSSIDRSRSLEIFQIQALQTWIDLTARADLVPRMLPPESVTRNREI
jgi:hypothetical protein